MSTYTDGSDPGDTGGGTAVLESSPDSSTSSDDSTPSVGTISDAAPGVPGSEESPVPRARFKEVNDKYTKLKWAEQYPDPERVRQQIALTDWLDRDPVGFFRHYENQLRTYGYLQSPQQAAPGQPNPNEMPQPDYQYRDEQGNIQRFYSADRMQQVVAFLENKVGSRIAPIEQFLGSQQTQMRAQHDAAQILADAQTWPHFADFQGDIWQAMQADRRLSLEAAYRQVVVPQIEHRARQGLASELQQKPGATTTSPATAQPQGSENLQKLSLQQLFKREMRKRGMGA